MQTLAVIGSQWGDEGKGKITDILAEKSDLVVRFQGGHNAGHTIWVNGKKTVLHIIPSGILNPKCISVIGHGVVFEPENFLKELKKIREDINVSPENLKISSSATVINSYHKYLDQARENSTSQKIGTTGKGIGPAYEDKISRRGLRVSDLFNKDVLFKRLSSSYLEKEILLKKLYNFDIPKLDEEVERLYSLGNEIKDFTTDTFSLIDKKLSEGKKIIYEGAQGILLDIDYGTYPYVTSSSTSSSGIFSGAGIPGNKIDEILGITKAYTTRVGEGPFPTEIFEEIGEEIQTKGKEFGATTGRKRRCGWLDLPLLKYAIKCSHISSLAITKLDILSNLKELKVCYAYEVDGKIIDCAYPGIDLYKAKPLYKNFKPFKDDFTENKKSTELSEYFDFIEKNLKVEIGIHAFGPDRNQIFFKKRYF